MKKNIIRCVSAVLIIALLYGLLFILPKNTSAELVGRINSARIVLGADLTLVVRAEVTESKAAPQMSFTRNGERTFTEGVYINDLNLWEFVYEGISVHYIADELEMKLIVDGNTIQSMDYTLIQYFESLRNSSASALGISDAAFLALKRTVADILEYGAMAQKYEGYKTDNLANKEDWVAAEKTPFFEAPQSDLAIVKAASGSRDKLDAIGLNLSNVIRFIVYFHAQNATELVISDGENSQTIAVSGLKAENGSYTAISNPVPASKFSAVYTITLKNNSEVFNQVKYSINSYVASKCNSGDENLSNIVKAIYNYGKSAAQYVEETRNDGILPTIVISSVQANPGDTDVPVDIRIVNNPGISSMLMELVYDKEALTLTGFSYNNTLPGSKVDYNPSARIPSVYWCDLSDKTGDFDFVTLYFTVSQNAGGRCPVSVSYDEDNIYNSNEDNVHFEITEGAVILSEKETTIDSPSLVVSETSAAAGQNNVAVTVRVVNNPGVAAMLLDLEYDTDKLTLTDYTYNSSLSGSKTAYNASARKQSVYWCDLSDKTGDFDFVTLYFTVDSAATGTATVSVSYDEDNVYNSSEDNVHFDVISGAVNIQ